jgi:hypothetical protein
LLRRADILSIVETQEGGRLGQILFAGWAGTMAGMDKYDPRIDSLVMETRTFWDSDVGNLSEEDKKWLVTAVHREPEKASKIQYERSHTGFTREITVTVADIERLYEERFAE